jgi:hypothetical protein
MTYDEFVNDPYYIGIVDKDRWGIDRVLWALYNLHVSDFKGLGVSQHLDIVVANGDSSISLEMMTQVSRKVRESAWFRENMPVDQSMGRLVFADRISVKPYIGVSRCNGMNLVCAVCRDVNKDEVNNMIARFNSRFLVSGLGKNVFGVFEV